MIASLVIVDDDGTLYLAPLAEGQVQQLVGGPTPAYPVLRIGDLTTGSIAFDLPDRKRRKLVIGTTYWEVPKFATQQEADEWLEQHSQGLG